MPRHVNWILTTMACWTDIQVLITSDSWTKQRLIVTGSGISILSFLWISTYCLVIFFEIKIWAFEKTFLQFMLPGVIHTKKILSISFSFKVILKS
uniref:Ovule protein n=1 Tax=Heterorhabditis bacteriophora TaxID=37862 RepID=A0A1I7X4G6_HETBA